MVIDCGSLSPPWPCAGISKTTLLTEGQALPPAAGVMSMMASPGFLTPMESTTLACNFQAPSLDVTSWSAWATVTRAESASAGRA